MDYLVSISPLVCAHVALPPLSYFSGQICRYQEIFDFIYMNITPKMCIDPSFVRSLMLDHKNVKVDQQWKWLSYMFVHSSYQHLLMNLRALCFSGFSVYKRLGVRGFYTVFFASGVASMLPSSLREAQDNKRSVGVKIMSELYGKLTGQGIMHCGSSGAVFGLFGAGAVISAVGLLSNLYYLLRDSGSRRVQENGEIVHRNIFGAPVAKQSHQRHNIDRVLFCTMDLIGTALLVQQEWNTAYNGQSNGVDNAAHVQGFIFGAGYSLLHIFLSHIH
mmetsp:Transcript_597/g.997  ORF Transcript_597/g.997 Transcript_597/m.997 type:complete len:275 (+) Transcript_597:74-898(+)